ncbi:MAG: hypothetical protein A3F46_07840 [Legionellales bacterium RIFCSPHIGHO2_12_FULL_42_9]|nr:MAG: hypothetical protein A3F46_07840 [Legionellales bacterium RIFCSPHIGHO2_12_FULL_42_9]
MKDNLFEILMNFFEKTLTQIKEANPETNSIVSPANTSADLDTVSISNNGNQVLRQRKKNSMRVFTSQEQLKFTKASYQFMVRLMRLELIAAEIIEEIIHQLLFSDSPFVTLQETKWAIRNTLASCLDSKQLAFLDLVLYQKEDRLPLN